MNIYNRQNEMRREIYSKLLKKRQQKSSTRLCNGVIVREWMKNKGHYHVMNLGPLAKGRHGVNRRLPQAERRSQKADISSSLDIVLKRSQLG